MSKLDDAIKAALSDEDAEFLARLEEEPGAFRQMAGVFQGPLNWIYIVFFLVAVISGFFCIYAVWQFAISTEMRPLFYWGATSGFCLLVITIVRLVFFMQINTNRLLREVKRLELQVAQISSRLKD